MRPGAIRHPGRIGFVALILLGLSAQTSHSHDITAPGSPSCIACHIAHERPADALERPASPRPSPVVAEVLQTAPVRRPAEDRCADAPEARAPPD